MYWGSHWFQLARSDQYSLSCGHQYHNKRVDPIEIAAAIWCWHWMGQVVCCRCNNSAVALVLNDHTNRDSKLMHLLRCLTSFEAKFSCRLVAAHISGSYNTSADDLSYYLQVFLSLSYMLALLCCIPGYLQLLYLYTC